MQRIIDEAIPSVDYSHFVSLPLAIHPALVHKLVNFQNSILAHSNEGLGIEKSIFINPKTFHLTVIMLKLWNKDRVNAATEILKSISTKVMDTLDNRPVFMKLKGLDCMRGSLAKAYVVYAPVEVVGGEDRLLHACQIITDAFVEAGLVLEKDAKQKLKLHATVMNAKHRKSKERNKKSESFDARGIFEQFGSEEWGNYHIREAHLSQRFKYDESGYFHCCASIPFPEKKGSTRFGAALFNSSVTTGRGDGSGTRVAGSSTSGRGAGSSVMRGRGALSVTTGRGDGSGMRGGGSSTRARGGGRGTSGRGTWRGVSGTSAGGHSHSS